MAATTAMQSPAGAISGISGHGAGAAGSAATALLNTVRTWRERSRSRAALATLSDRTLQDIGVTRSQALDESDRWFWQG